MSYSLRLVVLSVLVYVLVGCGGTAEVVGPPTQLPEVNQALYRHNATIVWTSGERLKNAKYVRVTADSVRYRMYTEPGGAGRWEHPLPFRRDEETRTRPIGDVREIVAHVGGGGGRGFAVGAMPGTFLAGVSAVGWFAKNCRESGDWSCRAIGRVWRRVSDSISVQSVHSAEDSSGW